MKPRGDRVSASMLATEQYSHYLRCVPTRASPRKGLRVQMQTRRRQFFVARLKNLHRKRVRKRARRIKKFVLTRRFVGRSSAPFRPLPLSDLAVPLVTTQKKPWKIFFRWR